MLVGDVDPDTGLTLAGVMHICGPRKPRHTGLPLWSCPECGWEGADWQRDGHTPLMCLSWVGDPAGLDRFLTDRDRAAAGL